MRTVTFGLNISLDGYCDHTAFNPSEELLDYFTEMLNDVDLLFFGRIMYQLMFPYWDDVAKAQSGSPAENRFAQKFSAINRVVVSTSLASPDENTQIIRSNPVAELLKLKQQPGKKILVDSVSMLPVLIAAKLIDEFKMVVHPAFVGQGRQLLVTGSLQENFDLKLINTTNFKSGCVALHYLRR